MFKFNHGWNFGWRSSIWFTTLVAGFGIAIDLLVYTILVPVVPFRLQSLGYTNVSGLTGWLLFAFSAGIVLSTPPIAYLSERYKARKVPLIIGLIALMAALVMFMEAPVYWLMVVSRVLQGVSSSVVWIVMLALICDTVDESQVGKQMGIAMIGLSIGALIAPPIGGVLYQNLGFRAPFIFSICLAFLDLIMRLLLVEKKHAPTDKSSQESLGTSSDERLGIVSPQAANEKLDDVKEGGNPEKQRSPPCASELATVQDPPPIGPSRSSSPLRVLILLLTSPRAYVAVLNTLIWGIALGAEEPTLPLHLQAVYGYNSEKVGLVYIASVLPTLFSNPISGWASDKWGGEFVTPLCMLISVPWWTLLLVKGPVAFLIVCLAFGGAFMSGAIAPVMSDLAALARDVDGIGYAHVYGAFNLAFGIGTAAGPIVGSQIYDHSATGWTILCILWGVLFGIAAIASFFFSGDKPLSVRLLGRSRWSSGLTGSTKAAENTAHV